MSGNSYLLDTNILIGLLKREPDALALLEKRPEVLDSCSVSQITRMELLSFPGLRAEDEEKIRELLAQCRIILLDETIEEEAISLRRMTRLRLPDALIAATARVHGLTLITLDAEVRNKLAAVSTTPGMVGNG
jgi:predicted nucleic acid-binding protein